MQSQWKVTKITKYKKCTVCIHRCAWYMYDSWRLVKYHRIILPTPPRNINAQRNWFIKDHTQHPWQAWTSAYFFQVKQKYLVSLLPFSINSSGIHKVLIWLFHTEELMWYIKSLTHDWPQNQWNISELKVPLPMLATRPQQPCRSGQHSDCKKQKGISTFSFYKEIMSASWAMLHER